MAGVCKRYCDMPRSLRKLVQRSSVNYFQVLVGRIHKADHRQSLHVIHTSVQVANVIYDLRLNGAGFAYVKKNKSILSGIYAILFNFIIIF